MNDREAVLARYLSYMHHTVKHALEFNTPENTSIAESAIRRYSAALVNDYRVMWEETESILLRVNRENEDLQKEIYEAERRLAEQQLRVRNLERDITRIERFHGIAK